MTKQVEDASTKCPECGAVAVAGRVGCQNLFDEVLAAAFADYRYAKVHRLIVDVYSLQHPDDYMRSAKSYAAHLTGMYIALEGDGQAATNRAVQQWLSGTKVLNRPGQPVPQQRGSLTVVYIHQAEDPDERIRRLHDWAASTWLAWRDYHSLAKAWVEAATSGA